ncbi:MAG: hypothetical protein U0232_18950 [Thermomicrobiales bacterium]
MLNMSVLDYEALARQKRGAGRGGASAHGGQTGTGAGSKSAGWRRAFLGTFRARLGGTDRATVAARTA